MALTLRQARTIVDACVEKASSMGVRQSIAVVDVAGHLLTLDRMDGAGLLREEFAVAKAFGAVFFRRPTSESAKLRESNPQLFEGAMSIFQGRMLLVGGGLPIQVGGELVGGVGVSGGTADQDEEVGRAGIAALGAG